MKVKAVRSYLYDIPPQVQRTDAIQAFISMEMPLVEIEDADGVVGVGFSYTIGKGGQAIQGVIDQYLIPIVLEEDASNIDRIWRRMWMETHWVGRGGIVGLGMAAIDIALWDLMAKRAGLPLYQLLGGAREAVPVYNTDGGWLHLTPDELVRQSVEFVERGFKGIKVKVGRDSLHEDVARIRAVRKAIGEIYNKYVFQEYIARGAADILQPDAVRVGGISEWIKVAHTAECFGLSVSPHFLMELHVHLSAAVPHSLFVEYIPSLDPVLADTLTLTDGHFSPPNRPGHGILFNPDKLAAHRVE